MDNMSSYDERNSSMRSTKMSFSRVSDIHTETGEKLADITVTTPVAGAAGTTNAKHEMSHSIYLSSRMNRHIRYFPCVT